MDKNMARAADIAREQGGMILGRQLREAVGKRRMRTAVAEGAVRRLWHGAYVLRHRESLLDRLRHADTVLGERVVPCLETAAALDSFDTSGDERLHLLAPHDWTSDRAELQLHWIIPTLPLNVIEGRPTMNPVETAVRLAARQRDEPHRLAVLDFALASGAVAQREQMVDLAARLSIRGIRGVRRVATWADPGPESPRESWLRWVLLDAGLPPPTVQFWVRLPSGLRYRLDLAWPEYKVACEYDGVAYHTGDALFRDRNRLNHLTGDRWLITFATNAMVTTHRHELVAQVASSLRSRGAHF